MNGGGFNNLCKKEFIKPPLGKKDKKQQQQDKKKAAEAKAGKRAKEEEDEAKVRAEQDQDLAEQDAEAEKRQAQVKLLQSTQRKAVKACSAGDWVRALLLYTECINIDPDDHLHFSNRALAQSKLGRHEEMLEDSAKCVELCPEFAKGWARLGNANFALQRYDAAEEAFQRALDLEPASVACREDLNALEQAREEAAQEDAFDSMLRALKALAPAELRARALEEGVREQSVEDAEGQEDAKEALVSLITAHRYIIDLAHADLVGLDLEQLRERALEEGLDEQTVAAAAERADSVEALQALVVEFLSNDLLVAAMDIIAEAQFEEVLEDNVDKEDGPDIEIVALDGDAELALGPGDVFLAGAYVDQKHGELVLPSGVRLGHRSMHKYYRQRLRSDSDKAVVLRLKTMDLHRRVEEKMAQQSRWKRENRGALSSKANRDALTSTAMRKHRTELHNMKMWHNLHMWGGGGGGSHYWGAGSKQYNKGNKVKGVILRHSQQGAKLQAQRNKANRGNASCAVLR